MSRVSVLNWEAVGGPLERVQCTEYTAAVFIAPIPHRLKVKNPVHHPRS